MALEVTSASRIGNTNNAGLHAGLGPGRAEQVPSGPCPPAGLREQSSSVQLRASLGACGGGKSGGR